MRNEQEMFVLLLEVAKNENKIRAVYLNGSRTKFGGGDFYFDQRYRYFIQFTDGNRIDLHLETIDPVLEEYKTDKLTIMLLDKDNMVPQIREPTDSEYWMKNAVSARAVII